MASSSPGSLSRQSNEEAHSFSLSWSILNRRKRQDDNFWQKGARLDEGLRAVIDTTEDPPLKTGLFAAFRDLSAPVLLFAISLSESGFEGDTGKSPVFLGGWWRGSRRRVASKCYCSTVAAHFSARRQTQEYGPASPSRLLFFRRSEIRFRWFYYSQHTVQACTRNWEGLITIRKTIHSCSFRRVVEATSGVCINNPKLPPTHASAGLLYARVCI